MDISTENKKKKKLDVASKKDLLEDKKLLKQLYYKISNHRILAEEPFSQHSNNMDFATYLKRQNHALNMINHYQEKINDIDTMNRLLYNGYDDDKDISKEIRYNVVEGANPYLDTQSTKLTFYPNSSYTLDKNK